MTPSILLLLAFGALGHAIVWVMLVSRLHAIALNRKLIDVLTLLCGLGVTLVPLAVAAGILRGNGAAVNAAWTYVAVCAVVCVISLAHRLHTLLHPERKGAVFSNHTTDYQAADRHHTPLTAPGISTWLSRLPGNQVLNIIVHEKQLVIPGLVATHDRVRIVHLSDFHMSGRITKPYFESVVERVNGTQPDVIAITGDLVERNHCIDWIPDTFGRLRAPGGVFYVLGNHDINIDVNRLKQGLADVGLIHVGGMCRQIRVRDTSLVIAGNELPWFGPAADLSNCPPHDARGLPLRIVLSHSPDQFGWAQAQDADLILAGHNHGGQIRMPLLGALLCPSLHGVRYAAGAFRAGNTILHVSRGTASLTPIRFNCPPEIAVLILRAADSAA